MTSVFIHGLDSSSKGTKASFFRKYFPHMIVNDFHGSLAERMTQLNLFFRPENDLVLVGSSLGGLMAVLYALRNKDKVKKLILLAPAFNFPDFGPYKKRKIDIPTTLYQGTRDTVTPIDTIKPIAKNIFEDLTFYEVDDDHNLHATFKNIPWTTLLSR